MKKKNTPLNSRDRRLRFSIRKFNVGVASVAVAAFFMANGQTVAANDGTSQSPEDQSAQLVTGLDTETTGTGTQDLQLTESSSPDLSSQEMTAVTEAEETPSESTPSSSETSDGSENHQSDSLDEADSLAGLVPASGLADSPAPAISPEQATPDKGDELATVSPANPEGASRLAATTYKLTYTDADTHKVVYQRNYAVIEETTNPHDQPHTFRITVALELEEAPALATYRLADEQPLTIVENAVATTITEKGADRHLNLFVTKKEAGTGATDTKEGYADFRALPGSQHETENINVGLIRTRASNTDPTAALEGNTTDNPGTWEIPNPEKTANSNLEEAAKQADLDPTNHLPLEGFAFDPNPDLQTSFILNLQGARGLETAEDVNVRHNKDYYITFSLPKNPEAPKVLHANLVSKSEGILETKLMAPEEIVTFEKLTAVHPHEYQMIYSTGNDGNQSLSVVYQGRPGPRVSIAYDRISPKAKDVVLAGVRVGLAGSTTQSTSYVVKATGELLAKYTRQGTMGDRFAAAGPVNFDNYELISEELPKNTTGILATDYQVGSKNAMSLKNVKRMYEIVKPDGTAVITIWHLNPDSPNVNDLYDINDTRTDNLSDYILMFTSEPVAPGSFNTLAATYKETRTNQNGQTYTVTGETFDMSQMVPGSGLHGGFRVPPINLPSPRREQFRLGGGATLQFRLPNDVMKNEQHVTYYYAERGDAKVYYVNEDGKEIKLLATVVKHGASGTPFNTATETLRPNQIQDTDGTFYEYKRIDTTNLRPASSPADDKRTVEKITTENGLVKVNTVQELTYVYSKMDYQKAKVEVFVQSDKNDESTKSETPIETTNLTGKSGDPIVYDKDTKLAELEKTGYEVIQNPTIDPTFDNDATVDQNFEIVVTPRIVPVTPEDPKTPGQPVDPDKPNTPVYPEPKDPETPYDKDSLVQEVNRTVTYVYEDGTTASETKTDKVTFRREARVNLVTGEVTYTPWEAANNDTTFDKIDSPAIVGYTPDQASVPEHANLQHDSEDIVEKVVYVKDGQKAKVEVFVQTDKTDESTKAETPIETTELTGKSGDPIVYDKDTKLAELEKKGYEVIKNPTIDPTFDNDATKDQTFEIVVTPRIVPVTPEDPKKPGEPVDPDKPNTPVYPEPKDPETPYDKDSLVQEVNRTVTYVYEDRTTASETKTDKVTFRREAHVNLVTGEVTYTPWEAVNGDNTFDQIDSPVITGYTPDQVAVPEHANLTQDSEDIVEQVVYVKDGQKAKVEVFVQTDKNDPATKSTSPLEKTELTGKSGDPIVYDKDAKLAELEKTGYEVIKNPTIDPTFDNDATKDQTFEIVVTPRIVPVTPEDPKKPGEPVDPDKPNTPVYPEPKDPETPYDKDSLVQEVNRTVTYVYEDGTTASETKTDKVTFRREARVNLVTGDVTYTPWEAVNGDNTFDQIDSPIITGYIADKANVPTHADLTQDSPDVVENVVYKKLGSYVPVTPGGDQPWTPIPYPNHPTDPTKPGTPVIPIPVVPDHEPVNPLTPTDGGYEPPVLPEDPTKDTPIPYKLQDKGRVIVRFEDTNGQEIKEAIVDTETVLVGLPYDTSDNRLDIIPGNGFRYVLMPERTIGDESGQVVKGDTIVTYVYAKVANWIPQIPGVPTEDQPKVPYPFDPTNPDKPVDPEKPSTPGGDKPVIPYVPGYEPVTPLVPVDPTDPTKGYIPPIPENPGEDTPVPYKPVPATPTPEEPKPTPPAQPEAPRPVTPAQPETPQPVAPQVAQATLPNTGDESSVALLAGVGLLGAAVALFSHRRQEN